MQATDEISENGSVVAGPVHSSFRELVESAVFYDKITAITDKIKDGKAVIAVNPRDISKAVGNKRANIIKIKSEKNIDLKITGDSTLKKREIKIA